MGSVFIYTSSYSRVRRRNLESPPSFSRELECIDTCNLDGRGMNGYKEAMEYNGMSFCECDAKIDYSSHASLAVILLILLILSFIASKFF